MTSDSSHGPSAPRTLIDALLDEQRDLSAVSKFARWHDKAGSESAEPALARQYRSLLPLTTPGPGEQYAFEVDLDACSGCKACVTACHSLNGLDENESWRSVGLLVASRDAQRISGPLLQHVTTACHHCVDPACLEGCPVLAYDKDPTTGIVRHLDDQCIGCTYCVMMCPYEVPQYSARLGIVRKCDMCHGRLAEGEAPACVQACPMEAIRIDVVSQSTMRAAAANDTGFLPDSPRPSLTVPTTRFRSTRPNLAQAHSAAAETLTVSHAHWELVAFLVLSQLSVGLACIATAGMGLSPDAVKASFTAAWVSQCIALGLATLHLGQPLRAWRSFLGWKRSWFSREVIVFSLYMFLLTGVTALAWRDSTLPGLSFATAAAGLAGVGCSAMIYAATRRRYWSLRATSLRFFAATAALGAGAVAILASPGTSLSAGLAGFALVALAAGFSAEQWVLNIDTSRVATYPEFERTAALLRGPLQVFWRTRCAIGALAAAFLALMAVGILVDPRSAWIAFSLLLIGAVMERLVFFVAVSPDRMPGGVSA